MKLQYMVKSMSVISNLLPVFKMRPSVYVKCPFYMDFKPMERKHFRPVTETLTSLAFDYDDIDRRLTILETQT